MFIKMKVCTIFLFTAIVFVAAAPGGFIEKSTVAADRTLYDLSFVPSTRGVFTFPAPYNTKGYRITEPADGKIYANGYSYWPKINQHKDDNVLYVLIGSSDSGPLIYSINKQTDEVLPLGSPFPPGSTNQYLLVDEMYFSHTEPYSFYHIQRGTSEWRKTNFKTNESVVIFDTTTQWPLTVPGQVQSSFDGQVHSFTLKNNTEYGVYGCGVYFAANSSFVLLEFPADEFDECQVDKSGEYLMIKTDLEGGVFGNRFVELKTGRYVDVLDPHCLGHSDTGYRSAVGAGDQLVPDAANGWMFDFEKLLDGYVSQNMTLVYSGPWRPEVVGFPNHYTWQNAKDPNIVPFEHQFACGSWADPTYQTSAKAQEVICFKMDNSLDVLIVAPVMTWMNASGGDIDYYKAPKAVIDPNGEYILWSTNLRSDRIDIIVAQVPWELLVKPSDYNPTPVAPIDVNSPTSGNSPSGGKSPSSAPKPQIAAASARLTNWVMIVTMICYVLRTLYY